MPVGPTNVMLNNWNVDEGKNLDKGLDTYVHETKFQVPFFKKLSGYILCSILSNILISLILHYFTKVYITSLYNKHIAGCTKQPHIALL